VVVVVGRGFQWVSSLTLHFRPNTTVIGVEEVLGGVGLKAPITVRDLHSGVRRDRIQLIGHKRQG
jgi:hypothetical protein